MLDDSTGQFKQEFQAGLNVVKAEVQTNKATSKGDVKEAAVVSNDKDSAQVLVIVDAVVTNTASTEGVQRRYRIKLDLVREKDRWLTADLQVGGLMPDRSRNRPRIAGQRRTSTGTTTAPPQPGIDETATGIDENPAEIDESLAEVEADAGRSDNEDLCRAGPGRDPGHIRALEGPRRGSRRDSDSYGQ